MKRFSLITFCLVSFQFYSQVKIGESPQNLNPSSLLELESTNKVFVLTRVTSTQMNAITPLQGALVYNIDEKCMYQFNGSTWTPLCNNGLSSDGIASIDFNNNSSVLTVLLNSGATKTVDLSTLNNTDDQTITDFSFDQSTTTLSITLEDGNTKTVDLQFLASSVTNQQLSFDSLTNILSLENGGTVDLSHFIDNTDNQQLSIDSTGHIISLENGSSVTITDNVDDADNDPTNENQTVTAGDGISVIQTLQDFKVSASIDNTSIGFNASNELEVKPGTDGQVLTTVGTEVKWAKAIGLLAEIYLTAGTQTISDTFTDINFGTDGIIDSGNFTATTNSINITQPGIYKITYRVSLGFGTNSNNRTESEFRLAKDNTEIPGSTTFGYHRNALNNRNTATATIIIQITNAGTHKITVQAKRISGAATLQTIPNATSILIEKQ